MTTKTDPSSTVPEIPPTPRLLWPRWQGAGVESIRGLFSEVPFEEARRGYAVGAAVLNAVLPAHTGPTALVPVEMGDRGLGKRDGIEAKEAVTAPLAGALEVIARHRPGRILTLGGECSVRVAPFSWLAERYGDDHAVPWIDSHPDVGTPASHSSGYHAMAVDSNEIVFGLGAEADGLASNDARRLVADVSDIADVVGLTIAEFVPRQVIRLQQVLRGFPLI